MELTDYSRFDEDMYLKDTRYACDFWEEHRLNVSAMLTRLLTEESLAKMLANARDLVMTYHTRSGTIPSSYLSEIEAAYTRLERHVLSQSTASSSSDGGGGSSSSSDTRQYHELSGKYREPGGAKLLVFDAMDGFYRTLDAAKHQAGKTFAQIFASCSNMDPFVRAVMPIEYDAEQCNALFLPQLLLYFMRLLSLYDSALKGQSVESFTQSAPSQVEDSLDEDTIKRAWSKAEIDPELAAHADDILDESDPDLVNVTVQASKPGGKELMMLRAAAQRANEELSNVWLGCREQFLAKWTGPGGDGAQAQPPVDPLERAAARLSALRRARTNVLGLAKGNYRSAMLYCPELSSKELCKEPSSSTQSSDVPPADDRQRSKSLEALLAPSFVELVSLVGSGNLRRNDRFLLFIKTKLSKMGKQDDFSVIAAMRHLVLTAYCFLVVAETMEIALDRVLMCIPGYSEGEIKATSRSAATRSPVPPTPVAAGAAGGAAAGTDIPDDIRAFSDDIFKNTPFVSTSNKARTRAAPPANSRYAPASTLANNSSGRKCTFVRCGHREKDGQTFQVCGPCRRAGIQVPYCSRECQTRDWKVSHKQQCVSQRASSSTAAASTASDAASSPTQSAPVADSSAAAITAVEEQATERPAVDGPCDASQAVHTPAEASAEQQPPSSPSPSPQAAGAQSNNTSTPAQ